MEFPFFIKYLKTLIFKLNSDIIINHINRMKIVNKNPILFSLIFMICQDDFYLRLQFVYKPEYLSQADF